MSKRDYYESLGVERTADAATLKKAYRKLAMECHPDRNQGDADSEHRFKEISEAYGVLRDDQKRAAYDRMGHAAFENGGMGGGGFDFSGSFSDVFEDLFGEFMGGGRQRRSAARRGADLQYNLEITLEEAFSGKNETVNIPTTATCADCEGTGAEPGTQPETCASCGGHGKIRTQQGLFLVERTCPSCRGAGRVIKDPCRACDGAGRVRKNKTLTVKIPPGVDEGTRIRLAGEGEAGLRGGPHGDLYIFLSVAPHELFHREGTTIFCRVPVPMSVAALGGSVEVPTICGNKARVKIPEGTQSGRQFRLKRKGMPQINTAFAGDMIIEASVETPVKLSSAQKKLLRQFTEEGGEANSPDARGFFEKARAFWAGADADSTADTED